MKKLWNKYTRSALIIVLGLILALVAFQLNRKNIAEQVQTEKIIVAKEDIAPFTALSKEQLEFREIVLSEVPEDAITSAETLDFNDAYASQYGFLKGTPIRQSLVTTAAASGIGTAVSLKEGMRQIGVKTDLVLSSGDEVKPGILVDAYAFVSDTATGQSKQMVLPELSSLKVVKRLNSEGKVPDPADGGSLIPAVIVLEVTPKQAALLMEYQETGKVYLLPAGTLQP
ncbi:MULTISPECIES: Flp pilus assembly protein CpaB [unclassified Paenibacillus]|uniref:Flp pilus assembly protein CpaB n=1 Tax=unclassified Paenibacillus TaxID=185978 RepID=UPI0024068136|nr:MULTISPECIES: Flp pilus assembly protein CpaB [unclassified Paenibacillus]MDF9841935.1 Flp pilus assembly protein CpaB [Paenibacillus sp. PastF-2]MDF9848384.1 Flp pilus assembly protein CpaB [Paenibacillus sp. PastM-2]MDF9855095.1 Flp pilus assembly protein CpaB [Paenibacillus sp. PastF-1]MDH6480364.1 Flp pilus assembly protein CpaB [Paenibacillus sp. PastH-2]MDH6507652.1 Flp pilus assembly protein CpaB [Paenibacillus sp. PastM-3]